MTKMLLQPNVTAFEAYSNAQIRMIEQTVQQCASGNGTNNSILTFHFASPKILRVVSTQVGMIVDGINSSSLSSSDLEKVLPALKALGELLDQCVEELKMAPWLYKFLFARSIAQLELTADRVDGIDGEYLPRGAEGQASVQPQRHLRDHRSRRAGTAGPA